MLSSAGSLVALGAPKVINSTPMKATTTFATVPSVTRSVDINIPPIKTVNIGPRLVKTDTVAIGKV